MQDVIEPYVLDTWIVVERGVYPPIECIVTHAARQCATVAGIGSVQMTDEGLLFYDPSNKQRVWFIGAGRQGRVSAVTRVRT